MHLVALFPLGMITMARVPTTSSVRPKPVTVFFRTAPVNVQMHFLLETVVLVLPCVWRPVLVPPSLSPLV